jgi:hypothetical protein
MPVSTENKTEGHALLQCVIMPFHANGVHVCVQSIDENVQPIHSILEASTPVKANFESVLKQLLIMT